MRYLAINLSKSKDMQVPMLPAETYSGKTILITGGGTGLGRSMAEYYLRLGAKVAISSRKLDVLEVAAKEMSEATGGIVLPLQCDVRNYNEVEEVIKRCEAELGGIDVLINNAAGNFISPTERLTHKAFDIVVDIVLKGSYNCTLALGKYWIANKRKGTVLSIVTTYATTGSAFVVPSACAKAGVAALTKSLAVEWARYGIRTVAVAPGPFPTEGAWSRLFPESVHKMMAPEKRIPLGRVGKHEELANLVTYLTSDYAGYINGEIVTIDGGEWLQGAGEFNQLTEVPEELWDAIERQVRGKK